MNTTDTTGTSGPRLSCVQDLLDHLSTLKNDGLGAQERLDFLMSSGPALVPGFSFADAFDAEARTRSARLQDMKDLDTGFRQLVSSWQAAPLPHEVRQAGGKLFEHLQGFVGDGLQAEVRSEIEMLSRLWGSDPDLRHLYPWLTGWTGPLAEPVPKKASSTSNPELSEEDELLKAAHEGILREFVQKNLEDTGLEGPDVLDEDATAGMKGDLERQVAALDQGKHMRRDYPLKKSSSDETEGAESGRVVAPVGKPNKEVQRKIIERLKDPEFRRALRHTGIPLPKKESGSSPEELAKLKQEAWTQALRDISLEKWEFRIEAKGHLGEWGMGDAMLWKHGLESYSGARLEWAPSREGHQNVRLFVSSNALGPRELKRELTDAQLLELHVDPSSFVEEALRIDPGSFMDESLR